MPEYASQGLLQVLTMTQRPMRRSKRVTTRVDGHEGHDQENEEPAMKKVKRDESAQEEDGGFTFTRKRALRPRKSLQQSGEAAPPTIVHQELKELPKTRRRKLSQSSVGHRAAEEDATVSKAPKRKSKGRGRSEVSLQNGHPTPPSSDHVAKIALPLSDTPVIRKNREFRKTKAGSRRSSVGMRGHRASSLIDNGHSGRD